MKKDDDWIRAESIEPTNGAIRINWFPPSLANNPEYMRRVGFRIAEITLPKIEPKIEVVEVAKDVEQNYSIEEAIPEAPKKRGRKKSIKTI